MVSLNQKISTCRVTGLTLLAFLLTSCSVIGQVEPPWKAAVAGDGPGDPSSLRSAAVVVENLPKSRRGNPPVYSVFGQAYRVMDSANDFKEWGVASWYGKKFHGRETSSGEIYDMHELTAAHKHLPLPTFVRVTRVDNGQSIVVKVNDRGPFVEDRIIDLSYAAAVQLDMQGEGKTDVFIEALSSHQVDKPIQQAAVKTINSDWIEATSTDLFIQVGAYSEVPNAQRMLERVQGVMTMPVAIAHDQDRALHRVRIGPLSDERMVQDTLESLNSVGIDSYTLVSEYP